MTIWVFLSLLLTFKVSAENREINHILNVTFISQQRCGSQYYCLEAVIMKKNAYIQTDYQSIFHEIESDYSKNGMHGYFLFPFLYVNRGILHFIFSIYADNQLYYCYYLVKKEDMKTSVIISRSARCFKQISDIELGIRHKRREMFWKPTETYLECVVFCTRTYEDSSNFYKCFGWNALKTTGDISTVYSTNENISYLAQLNLLDKKYQITSKISFKSTEMIHFVTNFIVRKINAPSYRAEKNYYPLGLSGSQLACEEKIYVQKSSENTNEEAEFVDKDYFSKIDNFNKGNTRITFQLCDKELSYYQIFHRYVVERNVSITEFGEKNTKTITITYPHNMRFNLVFYVFLRYKLNGFMVLWKYIVKDKSFIDTDKPTKYTEKLFITDVFPSDEISEDEWEFYKLELIGTEKLNGNITSMIFSLVLDIEDASFELSACAQVGSTSYQKSAIMDKVYRFILTINFMGEYLFDSSFCKLIVLKVSHNDKNFNLYTVARVDCHNNVNCNIINLNKTDMATHIKDKSRTEMERNKMIKYHLDEAIEAHKKVLEQLARENREKEAAARLLEQKRLESERLEKEKLLERERSIESKKKQNETIVKERQNKLTMEKEKEEANRKAAEKAQKAAEAKKKRDQEEESRKKREEEEKEKARLAQVAKEKEAAEQKEHEAMQAAQELQKQRNQEAKEKMENEEREKKEEILRKIEEQKNIIKNSQISNFTQNISIKNTVKPKLEQQKVEAQALGNVEKILKNFQKNITEETLTVFFFDKSSSGFSLKIANTKPVSKQPINNTNEGINSTRNKQNVHSSSDITDQKKTEVEISGDGLNERQNLTVAYYEPPKENSEIVSGVLVISHSESEDHIKNGNDSIHRNSMNKPIVMKFTVINPNISGSFNCVWTRENQSEFSSKGCNRSYGNNTDPKYKDVICTCDHLTSFAVMFGADPRDAETAAMKNVEFMLSNLTYLTTSISILFLVALMKKNLMEKKKTLKSKEVSALSVVYIFIYASFIISSRLSNEAILCTVMKFVCGYSQQVLYMTIALYGYRVYKNLVNVQLQKNWIMKDTGFILPWALPVMWLIPAIIIAKDDENESCFLNRDRYFTTILPVFVLVIFTNFILLSRIYQKTLGKKCASMSKEKRKSSIKLLVYLSLTLGVCWALQFLAVTHKMFEFLFVIVNGSQGSILYYNMNATKSQRYHRKKIVFTQFGGRSSILTSMSSLNSENE